jgi:hypothetical protein
MKIGLWCGQRRERAQIAIFSFVHFRSKQGAVDEKETKALQQAACWHIQRQSTKRTCFASFHLSFLYIRVTIAK